ncbi:hypothetical protein FSP39_003593 [Pinctada imbricata]|uniref:F-box domain-containing protein n=1 Tax=Pinctada imbricata TaxID=66713 RepID=A0AA88XS23_PINIB|nr:hypothetical protein FSP39_003593 [Pinctada imbricata]
MVEVCNNFNNNMSVLSSGVLLNSLVPEHSPLANGKMKHPGSDVEVFEFNIGKAQSLRCVSSDRATTCGKCESCVLTRQLKEVREWFPKMGDQSKKRFMLGLMRRLHSVDLLNQVVSLLQPLLNKDFTYSRSRSAPSLETDSVTLSSDRAMPAREVEYFISNTWTWFQKANYWTKANYALAMLQHCDSFLLHAIGAQSRTLLISEEKAASIAPGGDYIEASSIASTNYSFKSEDRPDLNLLIRSSPHYGIPKVDPFTGEELYLDDEIENDDSGDEPDVSSTPSVDPACMVVPTSAKAYSGVSKHIDFIRSLPVHLAKYILKLLDKTSLNNALLVSRNWRSLVQEVHEEEKINQLLTEDVMLMQGAAAQGVNHQYAKDIDVLVPNLYPGSRTTIRTDEEVVSPTYLQEINFNNAYSGVSTRKVIMEERNVYCGAYNVMVLSDQVDPHRVIHTGGGDLIAIGSKDRKVRFTAIEPDKVDTPMPNPITGHAGSIRCCHILEEQRLIISGSYDTSIRMWDIDTGSCKRIFRGHRDTILTITVVGDYLGSGAKDNSCKVFNLHTGKCHRTFRHRAPVWAVAMSAKSSSWSITSIKFDRWHIITGSTDGYALVWSSQGDHDRCLNALRHPKPVLCLEFMYLRVITGSQDGRIRIWNMVNSQCCRIMRGNSQSTPIRSIIALGDRITLNTDINLLVLNFEPVEWDYTLENDKIPSFVKYGCYADAPIRPQPYPYIRAQRMKRAGATNTKIVHHNKVIETLSEPRTPLQTQYRAAQLPHSAKSLSLKSMENARFIQSAGPESGYESGPSPRALPESRPTSERWTVSSQKSKHSSIAKPPLPKPKPTTPKTIPTHVNVMITDPKQKEYDDDEDDEGTPPTIMKRRVSWAFDTPYVPKSKEISLSETKAVLRSQMRMKAENQVPPDFIYLTINAIQNSMTSSETIHNTEKNMKLLAARFDGLTKRPSSSPSKIDPRTRIPVEEMSLDKLRPKQDDVETVSEVSDNKSVKSMKSNKTTKSMMSHGPDRELYATPCEVKPTKTKIRMSLHPKRIKTTVPSGRSIRPLSASVSRRQPPPDPEENIGRPVTAPSLRRPDTAISSVPSTIATVMPGLVPQQKRQPDRLTTSGYESNLVPMKMYPKDMKEKLSALIESKRRTKSETILRSASDTAIGKVSKYNDPMRSHVKFELRTYEQEQDHIKNVEHQYQKRLQEEDEMLEKKKRAAWLAKVKVRPTTVHGEKPDS